MKSKMMSYPYNIWMLIFVLIPLGMVVYFAFTTPEGIFTFENLSEIQSNVHIFVKSLLIALISTSVCLVIAYPFGYILSRQSMSMQKMMLMIIMIPMWMNFLLRIFAWMTILGENGVLNNILGVFGMRASIMNTQTAVIIGMVYNFLPFMILPIYTVMTKIDRGIIHAAQDLGANTFKVFTKVIIPLSIPGVISGITMVFVPAASTFLVAKYLGGPADSSNMLIGDVIEQVFMTNNHTGSALSLVLMVVIFIFIAVMNKFGNDDMEGIII